MRVDLHRQPYHANVRMLGDADDGRQWALITWQQHVSIDGHGRTVPYAAWVPAGQLSQPPWMEREALRVVKLPLLEYSVEMISASAGTCNAPTVPMALMRSFSIMTTLFASG